MSLKKKRKKRLPLNMSNFQIDIKFCLASVYTQKLSPLVFTYKMFRSNISSDCDCMKL